MRKFALALLALATAFAITPAAQADQQWSFSFATGNALPGWHGSGIIDVNNLGVIDYLSGVFYAGPVNLGMMTLDAPGSFASNDNVFTGPDHWFTENGLSFNVNGVDYNFFYYATSNNYIATCSVGTDCATKDAYGVPSYELGFNATETPEPSSLFLLGTGLLALAMLVFRRAKRPAFMLPW